MEVRHGLPTDETEVVALWRECGLVAAYNDPAADFRRALANSASAVIVLDDPASRTIIGSVMVGEDGHRGWLYYVASRPNVRGRGIGRLLVVAAENWLRRRGIAKVQLLVRPTNDTVLSFYQRLGYGETPRIVMAKWLADDKS